MGNGSATEYYNNGLQYAKDREWDKAIEFLNKAIAEDPKHVNSYNVLGKVHIQKGELNSARKCWRMALRIDPDNVTARQCLAAASKGPRQFQLKALLWPAVIVLLVAALVVTNSMLLRRIGALEVEIAELKAKKPEYKVQELQSQEVQPQKIKPIEEATAQPPAQSPRIPEQSTKERPTETELPEIKTASQVKGAYDQALSACLSGQYNQAAEVFQQILEYESSHPLKANAQYWLAECYYAQKSFAQAAAEFQKVKRNFPKSYKVFDAELKLAYTYYNLGHKEEARQKLLQLSKDWPQQLYQAKIAALSEKIQE